MTTLSELLAGQIASLMVESKFLLGEDAQRYTSKIANGTMKSEDWLLAVEKALDKESKK